MDTETLEGENLLGKRVEDLQEDVDIEGTSISGILKYVTDYTGFSGDPLEQEGNYLALHFDSDEGAVITVELIGGDLGRPVTLDEDGIIILRIKEGETSGKTDETIEVVATKGDYSTTVTYDLAGIRLMPQG